MAFPVYEFHHLELCYESLLNSTSYVDYKCAVGCRDRFYLFIFSDVRKDIYDFYIDSFSVVYLSFIW